MHYHQNMCNQSPAVIISKSTGEKNQTETCQTFQSVQTLFITLNQLNQRIETERIFHSSCFKYINNEGKGIFNATLMDRVTSAPVLYCVSGLNKIHPCS